MDYFYFHDQQNFYYFDSMKQQQHQIEEDFSFYGQEQEAAAAAAAANYGLNKADNYINYKAHSNHQAHHQRKALASIQNHNLALVPRREREAEERRRFYDELERVRLAKRNARERYRVHLVNKEFVRLKQHLTSTSFFRDLVHQVDDNGDEEADEEREETTRAQQRKVKRKISKLNTLRLAIEYINHLMQLLAAQNQSEWRINDCSFDSDLSTMSSNITNHTNNTNNTNKISQNTCIT